MRGGADGENPQADSAEEGLDLKTHEIVTRVQTKNGTVTRLSHQAP